MNDVICRPIQMWPGEYTEQRQRSRFRTGFKSIMGLLHSELRWLQASSITLEIDVYEGDLRLDGWPRASACVPPPVKLSFDTPDGSMTFNTDRFDHWHDNLYAIALGLAALRKIERYGITDRGQQYTGWLAIESALVSAEESLRFLAETGGTSLHEDPKVIVRAARMATHPDHGGDAEMFARVQIAAGHLMEATE